MSCLSAFLPLNMLAFSLPPIIVHCLRILHGRLEFIFWVCRVCYIALSGYGVSFDCVALCVQITVFVPWAGRLSLAIACVCFLLRSVCFVRLALVVQCFGGFF